VWAEEVLRSRGSELTPESLHHLTLLATGDETQAAAARCNQNLRQRLAKFQ
jgi:hypothetical protein